MSKESILDKLIVCRGALKNALTDQMIQDIAHLANAVCDVPVTAACVKERITRIRDYQTRIEKVKAVPRIEQRTPIWYDTRKTLITASDIGQCLGVGKFGKPEDVIIKKCGYRQEHFNPTLAPLKWGTQYEPVVTEIYKRRNQVEVFEFGLIPHPTISHVGASPDGISELGVMLEIKCPYRRVIVDKITGEIPEQYYYQIQGQLDVCNMEECDYVECQFKEYDSIQEFQEDCDPYTENLTRSRQEKGVIIEIPTIDNFRYIYGPLGMTYQQTVGWIESELSSLDTEYKLVFYYVDKYICKRIFRNRSFMEDIYMELDTFWKRIQAYKADFSLYQKEIESIDCSTSSKKGKSTKKQEPKPVFDFTTKTATRDLNEFAFSDNV